jgi:futalosine hydrolase
MSRILLVAATELELCGRDGLVCGVGPVEAAAATAAALATRRPDAVLHVGLAGAAGIEPGTVVVGSESLYADLRAAVSLVASCAPDPRLVAAIRGTLPDAPFLPVTTSAAVSDAPPQADRRVEAMEGFGVLRACELAGVPAVEVRVISNEIGERDRARWHLDGALRALAETLPRLQAALASETSSKGTSR